MAPLRPPKRYSPVHRYWPMLLANADTKKSDAKIILPSIFSIFDPRIYIHRQLNIKCVPEK